MPAAFWKAARDDMGDMPHFQLGIHMQGGKGMWSIHDSSFQFHKEKDFWLSSSGIIPYNTHTRVHRALE